MATKNEPLKNNQKGPLSFDDLSASDLIRGTTPVDIKARCLTVCRSYLAGSWLNATEEDIEVTRITGGLTNQIYRVKLLKTDESVKRELCTDVAIKFYLPKLVANFDAEDGERLNDTIILTILSELGIHPRVFGIFKDGFVQEYVEVSFILIIIQKFIEFYSLFQHHQFGPEHQKQPELLRIVAHLMAKVHSLQVPIRKNLDALTSAMGRHIDEAYEDGRMELIKELNLKAFASVDLREEYPRFVDMLANANIKIVFTHTDFRGSNILVSKKNPTRILLTDLEYSSYAFRGFDLAIFMFDWGKEPLVSLADPRLPDDDVIRAFIRLYIEGAELLAPGYVDKEENSVENILREVKLCALQMFFFSNTLAINRKENLVEKVPFNLHETMVS